MASPLNTGRKEARVGVKKGGRKFREEDRLNKREKRQGKGEAYPA